MAKQKIIDFTVWTTQQQFANELGVNVQNVHNWIRRQQLTAKAFPELNNQVLVDRTSLTITPRIKAKG